MINRTRFTRALVILLLFAAAATPAEMLHSGNTSNITRFVITDANTGEGALGLASSSSGLVISTISDNEASATVYTSAGSTVETIATLGTYATPTAGKCRFKEVSSANHPGLYEMQFADARFSVTGAKRVYITVSGVSGARQANYEIQLTQFDPYSTSGGLTTITGLLSSLNTSISAVHDIIGLPVVTIADDIATRLAATAYTVPPTAAANATAVLAATNGSATVSSQLQHLDTNVSEGGSTTISVDNQKIVTARTRKLGTRADGVTAAYPDIQPRTGETLPWWVDTTAFAGGEWPETVTNVVSSDTSAVTIPTSGDAAKVGVNREDAVIWATGVWATGHESADISFDINMHGGQVIKAVMHAKKPTQ